MSARRDPRFDGPLDDALRAARPDDPSAEAAEQSAVRVLARVAVLEAGARTTPRRRPWRRMAAAAVVLGAIGLLPQATNEHPPMPGPEGSTDASHEPATSEDPTWAVHITDALDGDELARRRVVRGGLAARRALLDTAEADGAYGRYDRARGSLALLGEAGRLRDEKESRRVGGLAAHRELVGTAAPLLAGAWGPYGVRELERLLIEDHEAEDAVVAALETMASAGRRAPALRALLAGAARGRVHASAAAVRVGGAGGIERVVAVTSPRALQGPELRRAVQAASVTLRTRLLRLAERGNTGALLLASHAQVPGIVDRLATEALSDEPARARRAVDLLAEHGGLRATLALARAMEGEAGEAARFRIEAMPASVDAALVEHARRHTRDGATVIAALVAREDSGAEALATLVRVPRFTERALRALADLAVGGDVYAADRLVALASTSRARAVARALRAAGAQDDDVLRRVEAQRAVARSTTPRTGRGSI